MSCWQGQLGEQWRDVRVLCHQPGMKLKLHPAVVVVLVIAADCGLEQRRGPEGEAVQYVNRVVVGQRVAVRPRGVTGLNAAAVRVGRWLCACDASEPEVGDVHAARGRHQDVPRLDVPVDDAGVVGGGQAIGSAHARRLTARISIVQHASAAANTNDPARLCV
mgnify:CR=1 FL=1